MQKFCVFYFETGKSKDKLENGIQQLALRESGY
jgi:hypothetical protein